MKIKNRKFIRALKKKGKLKKPKMGNKKKKITKIKKRGEKKKKKIKKRWEKKLKEI